MREPVLAALLLGKAAQASERGVELSLSEPIPPRSVVLTGSAEGGLGSGRGSGRVTLEPTADGGTVVSYSYEAAVGGKVAAVGGRLLDGRRAGRLLAPAPIGLPIP